AEKERSWSTIVFIASLSWRISPRTSTLTFPTRPSSDMAIVTSAMLRTWAVRLEAIELTLSVSSFQTPLTFLTFAWPPSLPSVPTSRATRVTSDVKTPSCAIIVLQILALRRNSPSSGRPSTSRLMTWVRSPLATPPMVRVISLMGQTRSEMSELTDSSMRRHAPPAGEKAARCRILPSRPTARLTRSSSPAMVWLASMMSLKASAILPSMPAQSDGRRTEKSPLRVARRTRSSSRVSKPFFRSPWLPLGDGAVAFSGAGAEGCAGGDGPLRTEERCVRISYSSFFPASDPAAPRLFLTGLTSHVFHKGGEARGCCYSIATPGGETQKYCRADCTRGTNQRIDQ